MGTFRVGCKIETHVDRRQAITVASGLVEAGSNYTWILAKTFEKIGVNCGKKNLAFTMANGQTVMRNAEVAILPVDKHFAIDDVVLAEPGGMTLLEAHTLEDLSQVVNPRRKDIVAARLLPAA